MSKHQKVSIIKIPKQRLGSKTIYPFRDACGNCVNITLDNFCNWSITNIIILENEPERVKFKGYDLEHETHRRETDEFNYVNIKYDICQGFKRLTIEQQALLVKDLQKNLIINKENIAT